MRMVVLRLVFFILLSSCAEAGQTRTTLLVTATIVEPDPVVSTVVQKNGKVVSVCMVSNGQLCPENNQPKIDVSCNSMPSGNRSCLVTVMY